MKVLLISRVISPFQFELGKAWRAAGHDYQILFSNGSIGDRPKHWELDELPSWCHTVDIESRPWKVKAILNRINPTHVIYGGLRGYAIPLVGRWCKKHNVPMAFWLEKPGSAEGITGLLRTTIYENNLRWATHIFAIGPTALERYRPMSRNHQRLFNIPYAQDLSPNFEFERVYDPKASTVRFLFSGKLHQVNNIWEMLAGFRKVARQSAAARFVLSAYGPQTGQVKQMLQSDELLRDRVSWDVDFEVWNDRLRPFKNSDVLIQPALEAGWSLVVPEAMALAMPVISTRFVEAANHLIRDGVNGYICKPTAQDFSRVMLNYINDRSLLKTHGVAARGAARCVHAPEIVTDFAEAFI